MSQRTNVLLLKIPKKFHTEINFLLIWKVIQIRPKFNFEEHIQIIYNAFFFKRKYAAVPTISIINKKELSTASFFFNMDQLQLS